MYGIRSQKIEEPKLEETSGSCKVGNSHSSYSYSFTMIKKNMRHIKVIRTYKTTKVSNAKGILCLRLKIW